MALRELTQEEKNDAEQRDKDRRRFMVVFEGIGWISLIGFCLFFARQCHMI